MATPNLGKTAICLPRSGAHTTNSRSPAERAACQSLPGGAHFPARRSATRSKLPSNNGVGFLLRVTDVEHQPLRSMGFVSVIIVSALFALGLPLVLL